MHKALHRSLLGIVAISMLLVMAVGAAAPVRAQTYATSCSAVRGAVPPELRSQLQYAAALDDDGGVRNGPLCDSLRTLQILPPMDASEFHNSPEVQQALRNLDKDAELMDDVAIDMLFDLADIPFTFTTFNLCMAENPAVAATSEECRDFYQSISQGGGHHG
jgi:hypothetical protein